MKNLIKKLLNEESNKFLLFEELSLLIEKELTIGSSLKKKLNNINKPFADKLLGYLSSDKIPDKVTIDSIDYTSDDDKTITGYFMDREGNRKARKFKVGKLLDYIGIPKDEFKGYEIEELISYLKQGTIEEFKVVDGEDILWAYHCNNYDEGETMGSCMRYEAAQSYLKMYADNPNEVKCLVLLNPNNGKVRGRALLWHMDNDRVFMDRVYMTNDAYRNLFNLYKEKHNISNKANSSVTLENGGEYDEYPYMDTFKFYTPNKNILTIEALDADTIKLEDTGGGITSAGIYLDLGNHEGETVDEDDAYYLSYRTPSGYIEGYAHQDDIIYVNDHSYLLDDCIRTYDGEWLFRYDDNGGVYELTKGRYEGDYAHIDNIIELEPNYYGDGQFITTDDDYVHLDDEFYEIPYALSDDTVKTHNDKVILDNDAVTLYDAYYGESSFAHPDDATKVEIKGHGAAWVLNDDLDDLEEKEKERIENYKNIDLEHLEQSLKDGMITQNEYNEYKRRKLSVSENKSLIKKLLRESINKADVLNYIKSLPETIKLYRVVFLEKESDLDSTYPGSHYVLSKNTLLSSHSDVPHSGTEGKPYLLTVKAPKALIDVKTTVSNRIAYPHEQEITLLDKGKGASIIKIEPFKANDEFEDLGF
jgi:hypothetical protein